MEHSSARLHNTSPSINTAAQSRLLLTIIYKFKIIPPSPVGFDIHLTQMRELFNPLRVCVCAMCVYIHTYMYICVQRPTNVTVTACNSGISTKIWSFQAAAEPLITLLNETTIYVYYLFYGFHGCPNIYGKVPQPLQRASSQDARGKVTVSGIPNRLNYCVIL
jgi:hypothetical protein